ncbi:hypothetical protein EW145_g1224 [Phellinidium pouzarii]|uniref:Vacuolar protein sorting-associated protein 27 n=1 Tax=Phellinidium pouzarii TaxID=167371 RepID=A0A4S4LH20_9AGAM|nr:hypothetical protein EW145_g1224 [Phellinidium pouzarii]
MSLGSWLWGTTQVDEAIDKATSELLPTGTEDIALNLEISDQIRSKSVPPKDAMRALKRRLNHKNPNVQLLTLNVTDTCIKNGGDHFLVEVASREFMDNLVSILKIPVLNLDVKNKILRLIQNWAIAFEGKPSLAYVGQVYKTLMNEGFNFPPKDLASASSAMVDTQTAPEWIDSDVCLRCRTPFSFTNRKHHCRNCGQVFDQQCTSKMLPLPQFGIQQEVRVCDGCHIKLTKTKGLKDDSKKLHRRFSSPQHRSGRELADEELQRAIQLSLEEVGAASVNGRHSRPGYTPSQPEPSGYSKWQTSEPPLFDRATRPQANTTEDDEENDPELRAAIEASLREANAPRASAPIPVAVETPRPEAQSFSYAQSQSYPTSSSVSAPTMPNYDLQPLESDAILTFSQTVQEVEAHGGRDITRYPAVNELYDKANGLRPKLALSLDDADRKEKMLTDMHDKLSQAVKLYDQLLTEQLSRPAWRATPQHDQGRYNTVDSSYGQWTHTQPGPTVGPSYDQKSYTLPQASQSPPPVSTPYAPVRQSSYGAEPQLPAQQHYAPVPTQHYQQYSSGPPVSTAFSQTPFTQQAVQSTPASHYASYGQAVPPASFASSSAPLAQSPPVPVVPYSISPTPVSSNQPQSQYQPQFQPQPQVQSVQSPPMLSRQNTLSNAPQVYAPAQPQPTQQPPQQYHQPPAPGSSPSLSEIEPVTHLPHFPVAPTSDPQSITLYASGPNPAFAHTERKEALLIDL